MLVLVIYSSRHAVPVKKVSAIKMMLSSVIFHYIVGVCQKMFLGKAVPSV